MTPFLPPDNSNFSTKRLFDSFGNWFQFAVFPISSRPNLRNSVYCFMTESGYILYIGRAENLPNRLSGHERLDEAIAQGAQHLLVHTPLPGAIFPYKDVEERLITALCPPMNTQHNALAGLLSGGGIAPAGGGAPGLGLFNTTLQPTGALNSLAELMRGLESRPSAVPSGMGGLNALNDLMKALEPKSNPLAPFGFGSPWPLK